jgi:hypothetical protein
MSVCCSFSRQQRRRLKRLCNEVDRLIETDRRFFERRSDRDFRVRRSFRAEIEGDTILGDADHRFPKDQTWFTTVKQLRPGATLRSFFHADAGLEPDLFSEVTCRPVHEETVGANPQARDIERATAFTKEARP